MEIIARIKFSLVFIILLHWFQTKMLEFEYKRKNHEQMLGKSILET